MTDTLAPDSTAEAPPPSPLPALQQVEAAVRTVVGTTIRGLMVACPGVPPQLVLNMIAWQTGNMLAGGFQADLSSTLMVRKGIKEAFADGIAKAKIQPMPNAPPLPPGMMNGGNQR